MSADRQSLSDARLRLRSWVDDLQLSARLGFPTYANPGEIKSDLRIVLDALDAAGDPARWDEFLRLAKS